jgi:protein O-GlcNAc transferase
MSEATNGHGTGSAVPTPADLEANAHFQQARASLQRGQVADGVEHLRHCLKLSPGYIPAYLALAELLEGTGHHDGAAHVLRQALKLQPEAPQLRSELARLTTAPPPT